MIKTSHPHFLRLGVVGPLADKCVVSMLAPAVTNLRSVVDVRNSFGVWLKCVGHSKHVLDLFGNICSLPLGYNHPEIISTIRKNVHLVSQRQSNGHFPSVEYRKLVDQTLPRIIPSHMSPGETWTHVDMTGSLAVENLIKSCLHASHRTASNNNHHPPVKSVVIGFNGGFHGRTIGTTAVARGKDSGKNHIWLPLPRIPDWVTFDYPTRGADAIRVVDDMRAALEKYASDATARVACVIIEPVQAEGGDRHVHPSFPHNLCALCNEYGIPLLVDEVQTGLYTTGHLWGHHGWKLTPQAKNAIQGVAFSKKTGVAGFFANQQLVVDADQFVSNTWMGDAIHGHILQTVLDVIERENLQERVMSSGTAFKSGMHQLSEVHRNSEYRLDNVRGNGTMIAWDLPCQELRDKFMNKLFAAGVVVGRCAASYWHSDAPRRSQGSRRWVRGRFSN